MKGSFIRLGELLEGIEASVAGTGVKVKFRGGLREEINENNWTERGRDIFDAIKNMSDKKPVYIVIDELSECIGNMIMIEKNIQMGLCIAVEGYPKYQTIHHGFLMYSRNKAISDLFRSARSFVTDYFQIVLENLVEKYSYKDISYFKDFRKILIRICLNPISDFVKNDNENYKEVLNSFLKEEIIKTIDYKNNKIIVINNEYLKRKRSK